MGAPRWITYVEPARRGEDGKVSAVEHHRVRATLVEQKPGTEGFEGPDVLGGEWPQVYRHFLYATPRPVREGWQMVDDRDRELYVTSVREVSLGLGARMVEVSASRRSS